MSLGLSVTFTAAVTASSGTPTGTIYFYDGNLDLGGVSMSGGTASITHTFTVIGTHTFTAIYDPSPGTPLPVPALPATWTCNLFQAKIIVAGAYDGGGAQVYVFDSLTQAVKTTFFPYGSGFTGGVNVASGDLNDDGYDDVVTAPGPGGGPNVEVFSGKDGSLLMSFMAYNPYFTGGVTVPWR